MYEFMLDAEYPDLLNTVRLYTIKYKTGFSGAYVKTLVLTYQTELQGVEEIEEEAYRKGIKYDSITVCDDLHPCGWLVSVR